MATADQTVSAVLEATNKAYIVEQGDSADGSSHYRRWSDGTIEQCIACARVRATSLHNPLHETESYFFLGTV